MADTEVDPLSDEALGLGGRVPLASLGYDQTAEDRQTDPDDPLSNKALGLDAQGLPTQGTFADYLWSHSPEGHVLNAFGQGSKDAWGAVSTMRDDTMKALKDAGLHSDFVKSHMDVAKIFNQAFIRPAVNAAALVAGGIAGPLGGLMATGEQIGTEFRSEAEKQNKTLLGQAVAPVLGGIGEMTQAVSSGQYFGEGGLEGVHKADIAGAERVQARGVLDHIIQSQKDELAENIGRQTATQDGLYKARAEGTIGEGEEGYFNTRVPTDEQLKSRAEAAQEAGLPPPVSQSPVTDIHELALQIAPETFQEFDTHRQTVNDLVDQLTAARGKKFEDPEIAALVAEEDTLSRKKKLTNADKERLEKVTNRLDAVNLFHTPEEVELLKQLSAAREKLSDSQDEIQKVYDHARNLIPDGPTVPEVPLSPEMAEARKTGEAPAELDLQPKAPPTTYKTAKGSTYEVQEDGSTVRNKSFHPEHGADDVGIQPKSQATIYVTEEQADQLSLIQAQGAKGEMVLAPRPDGTWGIKYTTGPDAGKFERRTVLTPGKEPAVGLTPVEVFNGGRTVHFGNEITEVNRPQLKDDLTAPEMGATTAGPQTPVYKSPRQKTGSLRSGEEGVFRHSRQQDWSIGNKVNVGFLKNLTVMGKDDNIFVLQAENGKWYAAEPHRGLVQLDESEVPKHILPSYPQKEPVGDKVTGREQPLATAPEKPVQPPQSLEEGVGTSQPQEGPVEAPKVPTKPFKQSIEVRDFLSDSDHAYVSRHVSTNGTTQVYGSISTKPDLKNVGTGHGEIRLGEISVEGKPAVLVRDGSSVKLVMKSSDYDSFIPESERAGSNVPGYKPPENLVVVGKVTANPDGTVEHLVVSPELRRQGLGTALRDLAEEHLGAEPFKTKDLTAEGAAFMEARRQKALATTQRPSVEGTGDTQVRGLARSLEAKAIKDDLLETGLELPEYRKMALDKELQAVADHTADHYEDAVQIAMGEKAPPEGHYPESYLIAVQRAATAKGDVATIKALATRSELLTEATDMGRRLRILAELNKEDPVAAIKTLSEARKNSLARKGVNIQGEVQNISHDIDQRISDGASNTDLESLIKSIECP